MRRVAVLLAIVVTSVAGAVVAGQRTMPATRWIVRSASSLPPGVVAPVVFVLDTDGHPRRSLATVTLVSLADPSGDAIETWKGRAFRQGVGRWHIQARSPLRRLAMRVRARRETLHAVVGRGRGRLRFAATPSRCGDAVFDPGNAEQCEQDADCGSGRCAECRCVGWQPDPDFGADQTTVIEAGGVPFDAFRRPDGRLIVVTGQSVPPGAGHLIRVVQLLPDGGVDTAFADDGVLDTGLVPSFSQVALGTDGALLLAVRSAELQTTLRRFDDTGRLDPQFGDSGSLVLDGPVILPRAFGADGRVSLVIGESMARLLPDGTLDPDVGLVPLVPLPNVGESATLGMGVFDLEGRFVATHEFVPASGIITVVHCLTRFAASGAVDASFSGGFASFRDGIPPAFPANCVGASDVQQVTSYLPTLFPLPGGELLMTKRSHNRVGSVGSDNLIRVAADGASAVLLHSCGFKGGCPITLLLRAIDPEGSILTLRFVRPNERRVARLRPDGSLDLSFGRDGRLPTEGAGALLLLPDGAVIVASSRVDDDATPPDLVVERYRP
jgi:hypothetical protein